MKTQGRNTNSIKSEEKNIMTMIPFGNQVIVCVYNPMTRKTLIRLESKENNS